MATFCRKCGAPNEPDARFCEACGSPMSVSMQPAADVAPQAPNPNYESRSQAPRRRWALYAVGAVAILGIGIVAAAFFVPIGPLAGLVSTVRGLGVTGGETTLYYVGRNGKWGYVNKAGSEVISFEYDAPPPVRPGYAAYPTVIRSAAPYPVFKNGKWMAVNGRGAPVGQRVFDEIRSSPQSPIVCGRVGTDWGCVNAAGRDAISFKHEAVGMTFEGLIPVKSNGRWGFVDQTGAVLIQPSFLNIAAGFNHGLASVQFDDKNWGLIDRTGKEVGKKRYAYASMPGEGVWPVKDVDNWAIADLSGEVKQRLPNVLFIGPFQEGLATATWKNGRLPNLIDTSGKVVATLPYHGFADNFQNGLAAIRAGDLATKGFIRKDGRYVVPPLFDAVSDFVDGVAIVQKGTEAWTIDLTGRAIWPKEKQAVGAPTNNLESLKGWKWRVQKGESTGFTAEFGADTIHIGGPRSFDILYQSREPGILKTTIEGQSDDWEFLAYGNELVIFEKKERFPMLLTRAEPVATERAETSKAKETTAQGSSPFSGLPSLFGGSAGGGAGNTSSGSAGTPSESSARAVFEGMHSQSIQAGMLKLESFQKVNGQKLNTGGAESYKLEYVVTVVYPKGVMPFCVEVTKQGSYNQECFLAQLLGTTFKSVGHREQMTGHITFEITERGWRGQDGKFY